MSAGTTAEAADEVIVAQAEPGQGDADQREQEDGVVDDSTFAVVEERLVQGAVVGQVGEEGELDDWGLNEDEGMGPEALKGASETFAQFAAAVAAARAVTRRVVHTPNDTVEHRSPIRQRLHSPDRVFGPRASG
jgi:hypothetical protein